VSCVDACSLGISRDVAVLLRRLPTFSIAVPWAAIRVDVGAAGL